MTPAEFVRKWAASKGGERSVSQEHFIDLCRLLNEKTPNEADPTGVIIRFGPRILAVAAIAPLVLAPASVPTVYFP